jgi:hypothetical protein
MKKGSGDDPFADIDDEDDEAEDSEAEPLRSDVEDGGARDSSDEPDSSTKERYTDSDGSVGSTKVDAAETTDSTGVTADSTGVTTDSTGVTAEKEDRTDTDEADAMSKAEADGIPWVLRRSRVKEDRENVHQFFLREEYSTREDEILEAVAGELDMRRKDLQKLDVREAMVAAADPEDIAAVLREWGYEYLK